MKVRRIVHAGHVLARGFWFGPPLAEAQARARVLARYQAGAVVRRVAGGIALLLPEPVWTRVDSAPGAPLVRQGDVLATAPLTDAERANLAAAPDSIVLVRAGLATAHPPSAEQEEDPALWLDVAELVVVEAVSLGAPPLPPAVAPVPPPLDVRKTLGAPVASSEIPAVLEALAQLRGGGAAAPSGPGRSSVLGAAAGRVVGDALFALRGVAKLFASILSIFGARASDTAAPPTKSSGSSRALAALPQAPSGPGLLDRLRARVLDAAARLLVLSRLARFFERAHARYLSRMIDMFERGDLEEALRHAIPLGGEGGQGGPPAFLPGGPRGDLSISPFRAAPRGSIGLEGDLFEGLRAMYRRAFERLVEEGQIERAAFVLAELLGANEEAVSFLEKHGKLLLAAQIAEARDLPPGLVVRQWMVAGNLQRAMAVARAKGAFADAITRLERSGPPHDALAPVLRLKWADSLADAGAYAAAVDVAWALPDARPLARAWLDRAIEVGGVTAGRMLARKATLPGTFEDVRATLLALLAEPEPETDAARRAFATALVEGPATPETRVLARPAARAFLDARGLHREESASLVQRLANFSGDAALRADVRVLVAAPPVAHVRISTAATTGAGGRNVNEDFADFGHLRRNGGRNVTGGNLSGDGYFVHVLDGMGGGEGVRHVATLAANSFFETLTGDGAGRRSRDALARSLVAASADANRRIFEVATRDPLMRGTGSTSTCAALVDDALVVAHIGDSRAYLLRGGRLEQVTRDDSLVEAYKDHEPALTAEQVAELPHGVLVKALGLRAAAVPRLSLVPLQRGDVLLLTTDGVHGTLSDDAMRAILAVGNGPLDAVHRLGEATLKAGAEDNFTAIVASFDGADLPAQLAPGPWAFPFELPPSSVPDAAAVPLTTRTSPLVHERDKADSGALAIHDAARLPDGRIVVALGEIGVRVLSPAGKTLVHFGEPAHRLVVSEFGDRAIVLASRGEAWRLAKVDLVGKRVRAWRDARFELYAPSFDGARFFCAQDDTVFSVDAVSDGWDAAWSVTVDGGRIVHLELDLSELRIHVYIGDDRVVVWRYELATMILRGKNERPAPVRSHEGGWTTDGEELTIHDAGGIARIRLVLHGATAVRARLRPESFVVWDDRGRLLLLSTSTGRVLRDLRLSP